MTIWTNRQLPTIALSVIPQEQLDACYEAALEQLNGVLESRLEYAESHPDAGDAYLIDLKDQWESTNATERLKEWLTEKKIDLQEIEVEELAEYLISMDLIRAEEGSMFGPICEEDKVFILASYSVQEVEDQFIYKDDWNGADLLGLTVGQARAFFKRAEKKGDICATVSRDQALVYQATDAVWFSVSDKEDIEQAIEDLMEG